MNAQQLAVLAREIAQFCGAVCHLANTLHNEKRVARPDEISPLIHHDSRVAVALQGSDPNTLDYQPDELGRLGEVNYSQPLETLKVGGLEKPT